MRFGAVRRVMSYLFLLLMAGFAIFFGLTVFGQSSIRLDEAQSLFQTNRDIPGILYLVAQDVHVPLYHTLLYFWQLLFGQDIFVARLLSLVFFVAAIIMTYVTATYAFGRRSIGLFAALLVTLSPFMNWYGMEARMYTMLAFIAVAHTYLFLRVMRTPHAGYWILWVVVAILGLYTHYFFAFVLLPELVAAIMLRKKAAGQRFLIKFIVAGAVAGMALLPWLLYVFSLGFASNTQPALSQPSPGDLFDTYAQFIFGFQTPVVNTLIVSLWPIVVLLGFFALQRSDKKIPSTVIVFGLLATLPIIAAFIISVTIRPFYVSRYLIVALPALLIFIAWFLTRYRRSVAVTIRVLLVALMGVLFTLQAVSPNTPVKEDYRQAVSYLTERAGVSDVIVLSAPFTIYPIEYYYKGAAKLTTQPVWNRFASGSVPAYDAAKVEAETEQNVASYQTAWLVLSYDQGYNDDLKQYYDSRYEQRSERRISPGLVVYEYKIRYDTPLTLSQVQTGKD